MTRIETLEQILQQDPKNAFARYGLAMEYANSGQAESALREFTHLLAENPDYTAGYLMAAQTLAGMNRRDEAVRVLQDGIASAIRTGNTHARQEMQALLDELQSR